MYNGFFLTAAEHVLLAEVALSGLVRLLEAVPDGVAHRARRARRLGQRQRRLRQGARRRREVGRRGGGGVVVLARVSAPYVRKEIGSA